MPLVIYINETDHISDHDPSVVKFPIAFPLILLLSDRICAIRNIMKKRQRLFCSTVSIKIYHMILHKGVISIYIL